MKKQIADLFLIAGVITASIAAGESRRVSKTIPLQGDLSEEVLHQSVTSTFEQRFPESYVYQDRTVEAGTPLTADIVAWLRSSGLSSVRVLRQAKSSEELPVADGVALGRVLSKGLDLPAEMEEVHKGRIIDKNFIERLQASPLDEVRVSFNSASSGGDHPSVSWNLRDPSANDKSLKLEGATLAETIELPKRLKASTFLDAPTLELLAASGLETVPVKIPVKFAWQGWGMRWTFVIGALLTFFGVLLKRSKVTGTELEESAVSVSALASALVELEQAVDELAERVDLLDSTAIHEAVAPLLAGPIYQFAEGREAIRTAHGGGTYIAVMDAFARAERKLNRAWSAAVDDYAGEAGTSLKAARAPLREAREALPGTPGPPPRPALGLADESGDLRMPPDVPHGFGDS